MGAAGPAAPRQTWPGYETRNLVELAMQNCSTAPAARSQLREWVQEIAALKPGQSPGPAAWLTIYTSACHRILFPGLLKNENRARNLAIFSQLLNLPFQNYYHYNIVTYNNRVPAVPSVQ